MTEDPLRGPRLKIDRAYSQFEDIKSAVQSYVWRQPYRLFIDLDPQKTKHIVKLRRVFEVPDTVSAVVSDCIHNLCSSLDLLAACMAVKHGKSTAGVEFPMKRDMETFEDAIAKAEIRNSFGPKGIALLKELRPYQRPNSNVNPLYAMRQVDRRNKHIMLNSVAGNAALAKLRARFLKGATNPKTFNIAQHLAPGEKETLICEAPYTGADFEVNGEVTVDVTFGDVEPIEGAPLIPTLLIMRDATIYTFSRFEREFFDV